MWCVNIIQFCLLFFILLMHYSFLFNAVVTQYLIYCNVQSNDKWKLELISNMCVNNTIFSINKHLVYTVATNWSLMTGRCIGLAHTHTHTDSADWLSSTKMSTSLSLLSPTTDSGLHQSPAAGLLFEGRKPSHACIHGLGQLAYCCALARETSRHTQVIDSLI